MKKNMKILIICVAILVLSAVGISELYAQNQLNEGYAKYDEYKDNIQKYVEYRDEGDLTTAYMYRTLLELNREIAEKHFKEASRYDILGILVDKNNLPIPIR